MDSKEPPSENEPMEQQNVEGISQSTELTNPDENETMINSDDQTGSSGTPPDRPNRKKRWLKILIFIICLIALGGVALTQAPTESIVCQGCHEMKPEVATWQVSSHSKVACIQCHTDINIGHFFQLIHFTKKYNLPIQVTKPIPESVCLNCHSDYRTVTPKGDLLIPHKKHDEQGITCMDCHIGTAHGGIAERQETIDGDFNRWTAPVAKQNMSWQYKTMNMTGCVACHKERNVPIDCAVCHSKIITPPSHQAKEWLQNDLHGQAAIADIDSCNVCHSNSLNLVRVQDADKVISYTKSNTFCVTCHAKKPDSHNAQPFLHGDKATQDPTGCLVCHEKTTNKANDPTKVSCIDCHQKKHIIPEFHPVPIQNATGPSESCYTCHIQKSCIQCHK